MGDPLMQNMFLISKLFLQTLNVYWMSHLYKNYHSATKMFLVVFSKKKYCPGSFRLLRCFEAFGKYKTLSPENCTG